MIAALLLLVGELTAYASRELLGSDRFAGRAVGALEHEEVRDLVGARVADGIIQREPNLIAARPLIEGAAEGVVGSAPFEQLFRSAVEDLHRSVFGSDKDTVALKAADVAVLVIESLEEVAPDIAKSIPDGVEPRLVRISSDDARQPLVEAARIANDVEWVAIGALLMAVVLFLAAVAASADRHRTARRAGVAIAVVGVVVAVGLEVGRALVGGAIEDPAEAAAARGVWDAFLGELLLWNVALGVSGVVVAAAASSLIRPVEVGPLARRIWETAAATPSSPGRRALRAMAMAGVGVLLIAARDAILRLAVIAVGVALVYVGVAELLRMTLPAEAPDGWERRRPRVAWRRPALATLVAAVAIAGATAVIAVAAGGPDEELDVRTCNGAAELCDRSLDRISFPSTHNSMSAADQQGWLFAQQERGIPSQLEAGIRGLLIDTHYGVQTDRGVYTVLQRGSNSREKLVDAVGQRFVETAERLRSRIGYTGGGDREVYLCHAYCEVGATPAVSALESVRDFLIANPYEVLLVSIEDDTSPKSTAAAFEESGLLDLVWRGPVEADDLPTPREMIEANARVIVMVEEDAGDVPWMHQQFDLVQETPFSFASPEELVARRSCRPNRGGATNPLLLLNHWVDTSPAPRPTNAREVNAYRTLLQRARRCGRTRGRLANLVAVDFYEEGAVTRVAKTLNGLR